MTLDNGFLVILPMRGGSERIPRKNLLDLAGKPLYSWILDTVLTLEAAHVVVDTDDDEIAEHVSVHYSDVQIVRRPPRLGLGTTPMNEVILNTLSSTPPYDTVLQVHATNPFVRAESLQMAVDMVNTASQADAALSVTPLQARLWTEDGVAVNHDPDVLMRTQDLPMLLIENSSFYAFHRVAFLQTGNRLGRNPVPLAIAPLEAVDIDTPHDFAFAELLASGLMLLTGDLS